MPNVSFSFDNTIKELEAFARSTTGLFASSGVLEQYAYDLRRIRDGQILQATHWEIRPTFPLLIDHSEVTVNVNGTAHPLKASVSSDWEISCDPASLRKRRYERLLITGVATCKVVLSAGASRVASCHFDLQTPTGPGAKFHLQLSEHDQQLHFDIPRYASIHFAVVDVVDFLLGELCPSRWHTLNSKNTHDFNVWWKGQRDRLIEIVDFTRRAIPTSGAPWLNIKETCPHASGLSL